ncbi:MAG: MFS transporter [Heliobacteriaceae bacterium]|nr:MFS transporter [Heliobacteriaceae bacterium]MDD4587358.1 MFS transporter [Heliobacteriaceae bacterium]
MRVRTTATTVLFFTLFLVMVGFGIIIPLLPFLVLHFQGGSLALGFLMAVYSLMQFFVSPFWGRLSDRIGRRPVLLIGLSGYGITFILFGLATELWMLFIIRILSGIVSSATLPTAMAYIADNTAPDDRAKSMGMMGAAMGLGMICGPAIGGWLGHYSFSLPFFVAGGLGLFTLPFAFFFLPESLSQAKQPSRTIVPKLNLALIGHPQFPLFAVAFFGSVAMAGFESTFAIFAADRVNLGPKEMGLAFALFGVLGVVVQAGLIGRLVRQFGDVKLIMAGLAVYTVGFLLLIAAPEMISLVGFATFFCLGGFLLRPCLSTLVTKTAGDRQGASVGIMQSFDSLGRVIGPILGGTIYALNINLPYLFGAVLSAGVLAYIRPRLTVYTKGVS